MTYKQRLDPYVNDSEFNVGIAVYAFMEHTKIHGTPTGKVDDFFGVDGTFDTFLKMEADEKVITNTLIRHGRMESENKRANEMIAEGERLIREGYRILDNNSYVAHSDYVGERERTHSVSLVGIHDDDGTKKEE